MDINNIRKLLGHNSYGQIQEQIKEGKHYFQRGAENLPIDVSGSIRFLNDLEELFDSLWQAPKEQKILLSGPGSDRTPMHEETMEDYFQGTDDGLKNLQAEMRMILTRDNVVSYKGFFEFVETLMAVIGD